MKKTITSGILLGISLPIMAATPQTDTDSLNVETLNEVIIEAPKVIHKPDMDVYYPSQTALKSSSNGVQLLNNLMIPSLSIIDAMGTIQAAGQAVQIRINGRESSLDQVRALLPETIKRIEWIDNPGLRYNGASYVLNIIVSNLTVGGSLQAIAKPALNEGWGYYMADTKLNKGRSQFEVYGVFKLTDNLNSHRDYSETFTFTDGSSVTRREDASNGSVDNTMGQFAMSYNYIKPDTTVIMVEASVYRKFSDRTQYDGTLSLSNGTDNILLSDVQGSRGTTPAISAYWEQHFANKQTLVMDASGSFYIGRSYSDYLEQTPTYIPLSDIHTSIRDRNQAYAIEADYIKNWKNSRLTAGASYTANRNRSVYENLEGEVFHQRQDRVYFFAEYYQRLDKFSVTAGLGAQYTDFKFRETGQGRAAWNMRPQATLSYAINNRHRLRLNFNTWQSTPTLAQTNIAPQQIDGFQWRIGNPDLKPSDSYMLTLMYNFGIPRVNGSFGIRAFTSPNAITPLLHWQDDRLITTYENSHGLSNISFFVSPQIEIIPDWFVVSGYLQYRAERMHGTGYKLNNRNWSGNVALNVSHWGWTLSGQYVKAQRDLWGESISWGEDISILDLSYNWKDWQFGAGIIMPFGTYDQGSMSLSKWNNNQQHMRLDMRIPYISLSYNLQWGHQRHDARKLINADANVDSSKAAGR